MSPLERAAKAAYENFYGDLLTNRTFGWENIARGERDFWIASTRAALETEDASEFVLSQINTELRAEIERLRAALKSLWNGTVWGAGKGAVFESHRRTLIDAGIEDIGD